MAERGPSDSPRHDREPSRDDPRSDDPRGDVASTSLADAATNDAAEAPEIAGEAIPETYVLEANYPNPFNPTTTIRYGLPEAAAVSLVVYDALGREVERLVEGLREAGMHTVTFEAGALPSGWYLYRLTTPGGITPRAMLLLK